jgi:DNA-binding CsgD family transcriptional regulator
VAPVRDAPRLTYREAEVLVLLSRGHKAASIGRMLGCSPRTVHRHLANLYAKLEVADRLMAVQRAHQLGLLGPDAPGPDVPGRG